MRSAQPWNTLLWLLAVALTLPALPVGAAPAAPAADGPPALADLALPLLALAAHPSGATLDAAVASFLDRATPYASRDLVPPESIYRGLQPVCDLNGDGRPDLLVNDLQLRRSGEYNSGASTIRALDGTSGAPLWTVHNQRYATLDTPHGYSSSRPGQPNPQAPPNLAPTVDVNGDGVCDFLAYGYASSLDQIDIPPALGPDCPGFATPIVGNPSIDCVAVTIRMLDGRNGTTLWSNLLQASTLDTSEPIFGEEKTNLVLGFPTAVALALSPQGPRFLVKTTDVQYAEVDDAIGGLTSLALGGDELYYTSTTTGEHLLEGNATDGSAVWTRDFNLDPEASHTNITWVSGFQDVTGDGQPDVVMDQLFLANPRGREAVNPLTNQPLYRNGRGMRMMALDGAAGAPLWSTVVLDPGPVQTAPADEASTEILAWNLGTVIPDFTGDGHPDPVAQYLTEEFVGGTPNGRHRTHFVPVDGATGTPLWNHPQQGWGFLTNLGTGPRGPVLAAATLDVPAPTPPGGAYPEKSVRIAGLAMDGTAGWSFEAPFAQDAQASYELGLHQVHDALAPADLDGDGVRDPVTPAQYVPPAGNDQVFLATARQHFQVLSGASGRRLQDLDSWGSNGLLLPCSGPTGLTFAVGHAKRIDLERFDAQGALVWRAPVWNFQEPRSSTASLDLVALDGVCADLPGGTVYGLNMEAFSFFRRYEIVPLLGFLKTNGTPEWQMQGLASGQPKVITPAPPAPSLLEGLDQPHARFLPAGLPTAVATGGLAVLGVALGLLLAIPVAKAVRRRRRRLDPLGIALMLIVLPGMGFHDGASSAYPDVAVPAAAHVQHAAVPAQPAAPASA
ncbi:MAG: hypothetical protein QOI63_1541, partial [Thermoplasmata archaeon]|nr:hypothetical protein [Thermoplasmata archaeon]